MKIAQTGFERCFVQLSYFVERKELEVNNFETTWKSKCLFVICTSKSYDSNEPGSTGSSSSFGGTLFTTFSLKTVNKTLGRRTQKETHTLEERKEELVQTVIKVDLTSQLVGEVTRGVKVEKCSSWKSFEVNAVTSICSFRKIIQLKQMLRKWTFANSQVKVTTCATFVNNSSTCTQMWSI